LPGEAVTAADAALIELKPFRTFRVGEIVAVALMDPSAMSSSSTTSLKYARVMSIGSNEGVSKQDSSDGGLRRISLKVGGTRTVSFLTTDVFSFRSARSRDAGNDAARQRPAEGEGNQSRSFAVSSSAVAVTDGAADHATPLRRHNAGREGNAGATSDGGNAVPKDYVSRDELLQALSGLLNRAGIPTDLTSESMMTRVIDLTSTNARLQQDLQGERAQLAEAKDALARATAANKCQICVSEDSTHVMVPCGHTMCRQCISKLQRNKCPFCRTNIVSKVRFFHETDEQQNDVTL